MSGTGPPGATARPDPGPVHDRYGDEPAAARLEERARRLARAPAAAPTGEPHLIAVVGGRTAVAVPVDRARTVIPAGVRSRLPGPRTLLGLTAVQGSLVPVVDLAELLQVEPATAPGPGLLLLVDDHGDSLALRVERVDGIVPVDRAHRRSSPEATPAAHRLVAGIAPSGALVLDVDALLSDPRLAPLDANGSPPPTTGSRRPLP